jgi:peptidoglycan/LPS O-acetylase OafA/YrhL
MAGVVLLSALDPPAILVTPLLVRVGQVSYSMYLVHFALLRPSLLVAEWLAPGDDWQTLLIHLVVTVLSSFGVACVTHRFIERPPMRWIAALTAVGPRPVRAAD